MQKESFTHCHYCGDLYHSIDLWPRVCKGCQNSVWQNPKPVVVALTPVSNGILLVKRSIEPCYGMWALPGGYLDIGETWQEGCARELREETGVEVDAAKIELAGVFSTGKEIIFFGHTEMVSVRQIEGFTPNHEVSEIMAARQPMELAFPSHTEFMRKAFGK